MEIDEIRLPIGDGTDVSALALRPPAARAAYVFAHGAGAGMRHAFMAAFAEGLAERGTATLRFQFPFMETHSKRPDPPRVAEAAVRAACREATRLFDGLPVFAGGKSFGGRMTSRAHANEPLAGVRGLVFVGFPLHPAGKPSVLRAEHLSRAAGPLLFLQGTRDELAEAALIRTTVDALGDRARLVFFDDADHAFHVRKASGSDDAKTLAAMLDTTVAWCDRVVRGD
jgi:uncharacterized protein